MRHLIALLMVLMLAGCGGGPDAEVLTQGVRDRVAEALPAGTVQTDCAFDSFELVGETVRVTFQTGQTTVGDVLVGADGLYSSVRARLQGIERLPVPIYSGMCCWRGYFDAAGLSLDDRYSWAELWGQGDRFGYFNVGGSCWSFYAMVSAPPGGNDAAEGGSLRAQDVRTPADPAGLSGTIIRIDPDTGEAMPDNPMAASPDPNTRRIISGETALKLYFT